MSDDAATTPQNSHPPSLPHIARALGPTGVLATFALVLPPLGSILLFYAMATTDLGPWLRSHGWLGAALFALVFAVLAGIAVLPTYAQCALAGWAFGFTTGLTASLVGFVGGALIGYVIGHRVSGNRVETLIASQPRWAAIRSAFLGPPGHPPSFWRVTGLVTLLRFPPNSPFALTNLVLSSLKLPATAFALGTLLGMAPRSALAVFVGAMIQQAFSREALSSVAPTWLKLLALATALVVVMILGLIANRAITQLEKNNPNP
jgi:uncharacterized membrane protein YdjX (TVP38/TMEM64 family)